MFGCHLKLTLVSLTAGDTHQLGTMLPRSQSLVNLPGRHLADALQASAVSGAAVMRRGHAEGRCSILYSLRRTPIHT